MPTKREIFESIYDPDAMWDETRQSYVWRNLTKTINPLVNDMWLAFCDGYDAGEAERQGLAAQIERLRESIIDLLGVIECDCNGDPEHPLVVSAREVLAEAPAQSLNTVRAEAIEDAVEQARNADPFLTSEYHCDRLLRAVSAYSQSIRQSANKTEGKDHE